MANPPNVYCGADMSMCGSGVLRRLILNRLFLELLARRLSLIPPFCVGGRLDATGLTWRVSTRRVYEENAQPADGGTGLARVAEINFASTATLRLPSKEFVRSGFLA